MPSKCFLQIGDDDDVILCRLSIKVPLFWFQQPAGLTKGNVDQGASTKKDEVHTEDGGEEKPGNSEALH